MTGRKLGWRRTRDQTFRRTLDLELGSGMPSACKIKELTTRSESPNMERPARMPAAGLRYAGCGRPAWLADGWCQKRWGVLGMPELISGWVLDWAVFGRSAPTGSDHQEIDRFPHASSSDRADPSRLPSHAFCVGTLDLASVSPTVRSVSDSVRRTHRFSLS